MRDCLVGSATEHKKRAMNITGNIIDLKENFIVSVGAAKEATISLTLLRKMYLVLKKKKNGEQC